MVVRERRDQRRHPVHEKPELLATGANQVWSWDITKLKGPMKVGLLLPVRDPGHLQLPHGGRMVADCESSSLARKLIRESCDKDRIEEDQLTLHADRGSSMKSKPGG
jgi:putative transposase